VLISPPQRLSSGLARLNLVMVRPPARQLGALGYRLPERRRVGVAIQSYFVYAVGSGSRKPVPFVVRVAALKMASERRRFYFREHASYPEAMLASTS